MIGHYKSYYAMGDTLEIRDEDITYAAKNRIGFYDYELILGKTSNGDGLALYLLDKNGCLIKTIPNTYVKGSKDLKEYLAALISKLAEVKRDIHQQLDSYYHVIGLKKSDLLCESLLIL